MDIRSRLKIDRKRLLPLIGLVAAVFAVYLSARPIWTFDEQEVQSRAVDEAKLRAEGVSGDELMRQRPFVVVSNVGLFAKAEVVARYGRVAINTDIIPPAKVIETSPPSKIIAYADTPVLRPNWDIIILGFGFVVVAIAGVLLLKPSEPRQPPVLVTQKFLVTEKSTKKKSAPPVNSMSSSTENYLVTDVQRALSRSEQLFSRSTLLLVSGVVMAFVGVGVFFVSLTEVSTVITSAVAGPPSAEAAVVQSSSNVMSWLQTIGSRQLFLTFKSTAMLIFLEAIAWFLLRQYRALIEDYKSFYRYYMRRANYLAAFKLAAEHSNQKLMGDVVETLLAEDLTGRLKRGETTETLESQRVIEPNFAETVVAKTSEVAQRAFGHGKAEVGKH
jgi:hypothetical protein